MSKADTMFELGRLSATEYKTRIAGLRAKISELKKQADIADPMLLRQFDDIWIKHDEEEKEPITELASSDILNATTWVPDPDFFNNPAEVGSQQLLKLGLYVYMYPKKIEIKGTLRKGNVSSAYRSGRCPRFR